MQRPHVPLGDLSIHAPVSSKGAGQAACRPAGGKALKCRRRLRSQLRSATRKCVTGFVAEFPEATSLATAARGITMRWPMWGTVGSTPSSTRRRMVVVEVRSTWAASRTQRSALVHRQVKGCPQAGLRAVSPGQRPFLCAKPYRRMSSDYAVLRSIYGGSVVSGDGRRRYEVVSSSMPDELDRVVVHQEPVDGEGTDGAG
jgi:hypothetical protein